MLSTHPRRYLLEDITVKLLKVLVRVELHIVDAFRYCLAWIAVMQMIRGIGHVAFLLNLVLVNRKYLHWLISSRHYPIRNSESCSADWIVLMTLSVVAS